MSEFRRVILKNFKDFKCPDPQCMAEYDEDEGVRPEAGPCSGNMIIAGFKDNVWTGGILCSWCRERLTPIVQAKDGMKLEVE